MMARFEEKKEVKKRGGINSEFGEAISQVMNEITDQIDQRTKQPWTFKRWCGYLRNIPPFEILEMLHKSKKAKHTGRMFNWQVKEYKAKYK